MVVCDMGDFGERDRKKAGKPGRTKSGLSQYWQNDGQIERAKHFGLPEPDAFLVERNYPHNAVSPAIRN